MIEIPTFETSKELAKYLPMTTKFYKISDEREFTVEQLSEACKELVKCFPMLNFENLAYIPAPTLVELLRVSPIFIEIKTLPIHFYITGEVFSPVEIIKSANLTEAVAKIIIQYYIIRSKENENI